MTRTTKQWPRRLAIFAAALGLTAVLPGLSVYDNVLLSLQAGDSMAALMLSRSRRRLHGRIMQTLARFRLDARSDELACALSHCQQQWLEIAMAIARGSSP